MLTCPICMYGNPDGSEVCLRCGKFRFPESAAQTASAGDPGLSQEYEAIRQVCSKLLKGVVDQAEQKTLRGPLTIPGVTTIHRRGVDGTESDTLSSEQTGDTGDLSKLKNTQPQLTVIRGERIGKEFLLFDGGNVIGRVSDQPVDVDLTGLEAPDQIWSSRRHAHIAVDGRTATIEDLSSLNGTFVNRSRLHPGQKRILMSGDTIQVGTVQFRVQL